MIENKFPFDLFNIEKNFSIKDINSTSNIVKNIKSSSNKNSSIFKLYKNEINQKTKDINEMYIVNDNEDMKNISEYLSNIKLKNYTVYDFSKKIYHYKYILFSKKKNINNFTSLLRKINIEKNFIGKNIYYDNPFFFDKIYKIDDLNNKIINDKVKDENNNNIKNALDNIYLGNLINISLPSIGPIYSVFNTNSKFNIVEFISQLLNYDEKKKYNEYLPLYGQDIDNIIVNILLNKKKKNNLWNNININDKNEEDKKYNYLKNFIKSINLHIGDVLEQEKKIKKKYIIPYDIIIENIGGIDNIIVKDSKAIEQFQIYKSGINKEYDNTSIKKFFDYNNKKINLLIEKIFINKNDESLKILEQPKVKSVLCAYLFFSINLFYDFYKKYFDKLNEIIIDISSTEIGKELNIEDTFNYIESLNISLYNFKLILLNNFYYLFQPSKISKNNYGMELNKNGYFVLEKDVISDNNLILDKFPFQKKIDNNSDNKLSLINFILYNKNNNDIYDYKKNLEIGGFSYNNNTTIHALNILNKYFDNIKLKNDLNIFLIDLLEKYFKENICVELLDDLKDFLNKTNISQNSKKSDIQTFLSNYYRKNKITSASYFIKVLTIENDVKISKKIDNQNNRIKDIYLLTSHIFNSKSEICKMLTLESNYIKDDVKNLLFSEYNKVLKEINKKIKSIQQLFKKNELDNINLNNKNENIEIKILNEKYWILLKDILKYKPLLFPFIDNNNNIKFININDLAINGKYSDDIIIEFPSLINTNYIINNIMSNFLFVFGKTKKGIENGNLFIIKNIFIEKIKKIEKPNLMRKVIYNLLTNILTYNKYNELINKESSIYKSFGLFSMKEKNKFNKFIISHNQCEKILKKI